VDVLPSSHSRNDDGYNSTLPVPFVHRLFRSSRAFGYCHTTTKNKSACMDEDDDQQQQQQEQILKDLSALLNTLTSIEEVLLDIDRLTSPSPIHDEGQTTTSSVYVKQQALIDELGQWKHIFQPNSNETTT
jgi:hypothetical protein